MMFDPKRKRIAPKIVGDALLREGRLMRLTADTETTGFVRSDTPYSTPAFPAITEWGDCLTDFAGNYLNSAQIFPRALQGVIAQPGSVLLQRFSEGPEQIESKELDPYWIAMAKVFWRIEQATFAYDQMATADERQFIHGKDFNKQLTSTENGRTPGQIDFSEEVIPIPLVDTENGGEIVYDYRWHPLRKKLSYRLGKDDFEDNIFYQEDDGSRWKWVDPVLDDRFFNAPYDIPIMRANAQRVGFDSNDATFLYSRAKITNKERKKNGLIDTRNIVYATALYGPQGEDGLKLGELVDPATGEIRRSEAQTAVMEKAMKHMNGIRMLMGGPMNINDGSFADLVMAHGAHVDAIMTASLENHCMDLAPWLYANIVNQSDETKLTKQILSRQASDNGKVMPVVSLPKKTEGKFHSESMYRFLDTDDQMGRFKRLVFLHTDGNFHKGINEDGKAFKDMNKNEWVDYLSMKKVRNNPDAPVRVMSVRKYPHHVDYTDVFQRTSLGKKYRGRMDEIEKDLIYIDENPIMQENIRAAQAEIQAKMRHGAHFPQVPLMEDEFSGLFGGEVPYFDDPESVRYQEGARTPHPIVKTIKGRMDNEYKFMKETDRALNQYAVKALLIDTYKDYFEGDTLGLYDNLLGSSTQIDKLRHVDLTDDEDPDHTKALENFTNFKTRVEDAYAKRTEAAGDDRTLFDDLINPRTGSSFFDENGQLAIETMQDAAHLRGVLRMHVNTARQALDNFADMTQNVYEKKFDAKAFPFKAIIDEIARPKKKGQKELSLYFDREPGSRSKKKKVTFTSPRDAVNFRAQVGRRMMDDYLAELSKEKSKIGNGEVDKNWCKPPKGNQKHRLLFASPNSGDNGSTPYITDKAGRALDIEFLKQQDEKYVLSNLKSEEWTINFHRLASEMDTLRLLKRFVDLEMTDDIPEPLYNFMYFANLMHELWGMPNETADVARASNLETFEFELERLELAASTQNPKLLEKSDNPLLADAAKAVQFEEGQRILAACRTWLNDMKTQFPKPDAKSAPELIEAGRHDAETGLPFDYISHKINRDPSKSMLEDNNFVVVDVPAYHLRNHIHTTEDNLPSQGVIVPQLDKTTKAAINRGKRVVFREIETGRIYAGGPNTVHDISDKQKSRYSTITEKFEGDYARAGQPIADKDTVSYIGIEKLYPLANTRRFEQNVQSFKLPSTQFDGLTYPQFSAFSDKQIRTIILPTDYCPQTLEVGKLLRLRETTAEVFSNMSGIVGQETGHIYDTTLKSVEGLDENGKVIGLTIEGLCDRFRNNQNKDMAEILEGSGFAGVDHLYGKLNQWRADGLKTRGQKLLVAHFEAVNDNYFANDRDEKLNMWGYFNALTSPSAAFALNGQHPSPSVYRDSHWTAEPEPS